MSGGQWCTAVGTFADSCGIVEYVSEVAVKDDRGRVSVTRYRELEHAPASRYSTCQPSPIPVRWRHRDEIGRVVLLERRGGQLGAVAVLPGPAEFFTDGGVELFWSSGTADDRSSAGLKIRELSLTPSPATNGLAPVRFFPGLPNEARGLHGSPRSLLSAAAEAMKGTYDPLKSDCLFVDDTPTSRDVGEDRGRVARNGEVMEYIERARRPCSR